MSLDSLRARQIWFSNTIPPEFKEGDLVLHYDAPIYREPSVIAKVSQTDGTQQIMLLDEDEYWVDADSYCLVRKVNNVSV